jgi:hypothetical protein
MKKPAKKAAPKKARVKREPEPDVNQPAQYLARKTTHETTVEDSRPVFFPPTQADVSRVMAELGRRGGRIGGKVRASRMTDEERSNAAAFAARAKWAKLRAAPGRSEP